MDVIKLYLDNDTSSIVEDILVGSKEYWKNTYSKVLKELKEIVETYVNTGNPLDFIESMSPSYLRWVSWVLLHNTDEYMERAFPNSKFVISMRISDLDKIITNDDLITVDFHEGFTRIMPFDKPVTPRSLIKAMISVGIDRENDNHKFLENFHLCKHRNVIEVFFGS
jgi:hypothetical protein